MRPGLTHVSNLHLQIVMMPWSHAFGVPTGFHAHRFTTQKPTLSREALGIRTPGRRTTWDHTVGRRLHPGRMTLGIPATVLDASEPAGGECRPDNARVSLARVRRQKPGILGARQRGTGSRCQIRPRVGGLASGHPGRVAGVCLRDSPRRGTLTPCQIPTAHERRVGGLRR